MTQQFPAAPRFDDAPTGCYHQNAGWSSLVARWAHNPKVGGSNPPPATNIRNNLGELAIEVPFCNVRELCAFAR